jgi:hypothetical protein
MYQSKSALGLGFEEQRKNSSGRKNWCLHIQDQSPKFELGLRSVPGTQAPNLLRPWVIRTTSTTTQTEVVTVEIRTIPPPPEEFKARRGHLAKSGRRDGKRSRGPADSEETQSITSTSVALPSAVKKSWSSQRSKFHSSMRSPPSVASSGRRKMATQDSQ